MKTSEKEMTDSEVKSVEVGILKYIKECCEANGLRYFLAYGTLLGAVRHQGFIPWDDDIDIYMPREDYERFLKLDALSGQGTYKVLSCRSDSRYYYQFAKVVSLQTRLEEKGLLPIKDYGVYVDVFPLDPSPVGGPLFPFLRFLNLMKTAAVNLRPSENLHHKEKAWIFRLVGIVSSLLGARRYAGLIDSLARHIPSARSGHIGSLVSIEGKKDVYSPEVFASSVKLKFEDDYFDVPAGYERCLEQMYGNYMELPPEAERVSRHIFKAYHKRMQ